MKTVFISFLAVFGLTTQLLAEPPKIEQVMTNQSDNGTWRFDVTISHPDTGWDHYADGWRVLDMQGNELAMRVLHHPHVDEQPFTRSVSGVRIPDGVQEVQIQARDLPGGWNDTTTVVKLR